jgi:hypothetical protein
VTFHVELQPIDRLRLQRALTAWATANRDDLDLVLLDVADDPDGTTRLLLAAFAYCDWISRNTGPLLDGDPGPDQP